jgi:hypothetical protein
MQLHYHFLRLFFPGPLFDTFAVMLLLPLSGVLSMLYGCHFPPSRF